MTAETTTTGLEELAQAAESAVTGLEELRPEAWTADDGRRGEAAPWAELDRDAQRGLEELRGAAVADLFPERVEPVGANLWADLEHWTALTNLSGGPMARVHGRALTGHPELAALMRSAHVLEMVRREGRRDPTTGRTDPEAAQVGAFVGGIAEQLAGEDEHEPAATILAERIPELQERRAKAIRRCEAEAEARSRAELAEFFRGLTATSHGLEIGRERLQPQEIAARIEEGEEHFIDLARHYWVHHPAGGGRPTHGHRLYA